MDIEQTPSPELPTIYAPSVLAAQGWRPTAADQAAITARADWLRELTGRADRFTITVMIRDTYDRSVIGTVAFENR